MIVTSVKFTLRKNIGNYEHEELVAEVSNDADKPSTGEEMMELARRLCVQQSTKYLEATRRKESGIFDGPSKSMEQNF